MFSFKAIGFAEQEYFLSQFESLKYDPEKILNLEIPASKKQDYLKLALYNGHEYLCIKLLSMGADLKKAVSALPGLKNPHYKVLPKCGAVLHL
ncbi:MAG: hypothetical protein ACKOAD_05840 [Gammaproteobacteria bacterium]